MGRMANVPLVGEPRNCQQDFEIAMIHVIVELQEEEIKTFISNNFLWQ